jgi:hypothetical protein
MGERARADPTQSTVEVVFDSVGRGLTPPRLFLHLSLNDLPQVHLA